MGNGAGAGTDRFSVFAVPQRGQVKRSFVRCFDDVTRSRASHVAHWTVRSSTIGGEFTFVGGGDIGGLGEFLAGMTVTRRSLSPSASAVPARSSGSFQAAGQPMGGSDFGRRPS